MTATGRFGSLSVEGAQADSLGSFVWQLPPQLCRVLPLTLVADGSLGSHSNALSLSAAVCQIAT